MKHDNNHHNERTTMYAPNKGHRQRYNILNWLQQVWVDQNSTT